MNALEAVIDRAIQGDIDILEWGRSISAFDSQGAKGRLVRLEPESGAERQAVVLTMRGSPEWKTWLKALSRHCHLKVSVCVDQALIEYAERRGFPESPPERTP